MVRQHLLKTGQENNLLVGHLVSCNIKKSMIVGDNTIQAERLGSFFKSLRKISTKAGNKLATNVSKSQGRGLDITANIATAAASGILEAALTPLPEDFNFSHNGKGLYLLRFG